MIIHHYWRGNRPKGKVSPPAKPKSEHHPCICQIFTFERVTTLPTPIDRFIADELRGELKAISFVRSGGRAFFRQTLEDFWQFVQVFVSLDSRKGLTAFTIHWGFFLADASLSNGHSASKTPRVDDAVLTLRIGSLMSPQADIWWVLGEDGVPKTRSGPTAMPMDLVRSRLVPILERVTTPADVVTLMESPEAPRITAAYTIDWVDLRKLLLSR